MAVKKKAEKKLTAKEEAFCQAYVRCWNAAEAARVAKYSEKSDRGIGSENLTKQHIKTRIKELIEENVQPDDLEGSLSSHLKNLTTFNLMKYVDSDGKFDTEKLREIDLPGIVNGYSYKDTYDKESGKLLNRQISVKTTDQLKSIEILAKIKKIYDDKPEVNNFILTGVSNKDMGM